MGQKRLAQLLREGADDYSQLLNGYPNAQKLANALDTDEPRIKPKEYVNPYAI